MAACVLDASFTCQWLFKEEASPDGYAALDAIDRQGAVVPMLWSIEITNVLGIAERRGRISAVDVHEALRLLRSLPLTVDGPPVLAGSEGVLALMREQRLTAYDATYLELAQRRRLPLATKDRELFAAAHATSVPVFQRDPAG